MLLIPLVRGVGSLLAIVSLGLTASCQLIDLGSILIGAEPGPMSHAATEPAASWQVPEVGRHEPPADGPWRRVAEVTMFEAGHEAPTVARYAPDGATLYVGFDDGRVVAWDLDGGRPRWQTPAPPARSGQSEVGGLAVSPSGEILAIVSGTGEAISMLDARSGGPLAALSAGPEAEACDGTPLQPIALAFDTQGALYGLYAHAPRTLLLAPPGGDCDGSTMIRWNVSRGAMDWQHRLDGQDQSCGSVTPAFALAPASAGGASPARTFLAGTGCDGSIFFLDPSNGKEIGRSPGPRELVPALRSRFPDLEADATAESLAWSPDGQRLFASYGTDAASGNHLGVLEGKSGTVPAGLKFLGQIQGPPADLVPSPDGRLLAQVLDRAYVFDVATGKVVYQSEAAHRGLAFHPSKQEIMTLDPYGFTLHHPTSEPAELATSAAAIATLRGNLKAW